MYCDGFNSHLREKVSLIPRDALDIEWEGIVFCAYIVNVPVWSWTSSLLSVSVAIPDLDGGHQKVTDAVKLNDSGEVSQRGLSTCSEFLPFQGMSPWEESSRKTQRCWRDYV